MAGDWSWVALVGIGIVAYLVLRRDVVSVLNFIPNTTSKLFNAVKSTPVAVASGIAGTITSAFNWVRGLFSGQ